MGGMQDNLASSSYILKSLVYCCVLCKQKQLTEYSAVPQKDNVLPKNFLYYTFNPISCLFYLFNSLVVVLRVIYVVE